MRNVSGYRMAWAIALAVAVVLIISGLVALKARAVSRDTWINPKYAAYCEEIGEGYDISPEILMAMVETESSGKANAVSQSGKGIGLMQVHYDLHMDRARKLGVTNLFDPHGNILVGTDLLYSFLLEYPDMGYALMRYNGQPDAMKRAESGSYSKYASKILSRAAEIERARGK